MERDFKLVPARSVHQSSIPPSRQHNEELSKSVKQLGVQQAIIDRVEIAQILTKILQALRKLKRQSNVLKQKMKPKTTGSDTQ